MSTPYDTYYQSPNLFGAPHEELVSFFSHCEPRKKILDLGCGQGRNAIPLAKMGHQVTGIDTSQIGIEYMLNLAQAASLRVEGIVGDIHQYDQYDTFDVILLDSMIHLTEKERPKEFQFLTRLLNSIKPHAWLCICMKNYPRQNQAKVLSQFISKIKGIVKIFETEFPYKFEDKASQHISVTPYKMLVWEKQSFMKGR
ncbi:MAG: class I SAM-dependent methyltransferase [Bacteroidota bacterium]